MIPKKYQDMIEANFRGRDYLMALKYKENTSDFTINRQEEDGSFTLCFEIEDYYTGHMHNVSVNRNSDMIQARCDCYDFRMRKSCSHLPAIFLKYYKEVFDVVEKDVLTRSRELLQQFSKKNQIKAVKKELNLEVTLQLEEDYDYYEGKYKKNCRVKLKIGKDKCYLLTDRKLYDVTGNLETGKDVVLGKNFTYNSSMYYFNPLDKEILEFFKSRRHLSLNRIALLERPVHFLSLLKEKKFTITIPSHGLSKEFYGYQEGFPLGTSLKKEQEKYILSFRKNDIDLFDNFEYMICGDTLYHTDEKSKQFLKELEERELTELEFKEEDLEDFSNGLLPLFKENIEIEDTIQDLVVLEKPMVKLYFDLYHDMVTCKIFLTYKNIEVNYFDKEQKGVLRDYTFENEVLEDLMMLGFRLEVEKESILLDDMDKVVEFIEKGILLLTEKYETFTSEKLKKVNILNTNSFRSNFSIGKDNILHYDFDLGKVSEKDLGNILANLKNKKKYFRLKSGDILNLENEELKQLERLMEEMNLNGNASSGVIPKYHAIYLDSLKQEKYSIIKTDNLFEEFIGKFNAYKNSELKFTEEECGVLRDYQVTGVKWLYNIHKCDLGGILADEMGLGKSIQVIYLIKKLLEEDKTARFLIVVPTSLVYNWENEFEKFAPKIKFEIFAGIKKFRHERLEKGTPSVYITSYGLLREDIDYYEKIDFTLCVIDEAQNIKNPKAGITKTVKQIKAQTHIALTGTPIENAIIELWSIFDFLMPGFLASETKFLSKYKVSDFNEKENNQLILLNQLISPFILRRKKKDVIKDLPDKINNHIYIDLSEKEKQLYASVVKDARKQMDDLIQERGYQKAKFMILVLLTKLRQLCIDPKLIFEDKSLPSSKLENLIKVVKEVIANDHKILLFTSFKEALDTVEKIFHQEGISTYRIDGSVPSKKRMQLVEKFNQDETNVFLIMLKSGGTGLNLTAADVVIHLDLWWNPQAENQATDRTHRIGQTNTVEVIKLIAKGTIEEKILELQEKKKKLSDRLIEGENRDQNLLEQLSEKEMRNLLAFDHQEE